MRCTTGNFIGILSLFMVLVFPYYVSNAQMYSITSGQWTDITTWNTSSVPGVGSRVIVSSGHTVRLIASSANPIREVVVEPNAQLVIDGGQLYLGIVGMSRQLLVHGHLSIINGGYIETSGAEITINGTMSMNTSMGIDAGQSIFTVNSLAEVEILNGSFYCLDFRLLSDGAVYVDGGNGINAAGAVNISGLLSSRGVFPSTRVFNSSGPFTVSGVLTIGATTVSGNYLLSQPINLLTGSEVRYVRSGNQTIEPSMSYHGLRLSGSGNKSVSSVLSVSDKFMIKDNARFVNTNNSTVNFGSNLIDSSATTDHQFGTGNYNFTGTTIAATTALNFTGSTVTFSGSSVTIGDGALGNAAITFGTVNVTNTNTTLTLGGNGYSGHVSFTGPLAMSGTNAALYANSGTLTLASLNASGTYAYVDFSNSGVTVIGNLQCAADLRIGAPTTVGGYCATGGDLLIDNELDVNGNTSVAGGLFCTSSGTGSNTFSGAVTVNGPEISITGGSNVFTSGLVHSTSATGSYCTLGGTLAVGSGTTVALNSETVSFTGNLSFHTLSVANSVGLFNATADFAVANTASFAKDLSMPGKTLTFLPSAPLSSMLGSGEVIGTVYRTLQAAGKYTFNGEYTTMMIPALSGDEEYSFTFMKMAPDQQAISRCYDIRRVSSDVTPAAGTYTLGLQYKDTELNGNDENTLLLCYGPYASAGEDQFSKLSTSNVNNSSNIVTYVYDGSMSLNQRYTLADANSPVPVELVAFSGRRKSHGVELRWATATEINNYGFEVERSFTRDDSYTSLGFVEGKGSSFSRSEYRFPDESAPAKTLYYRLRQIDRDGSASYGPVVEISGAAPVFELTNYPNPFNPTTTISFVGMEDGDAVLTVVNSLGETVAQPYAAQVLRGERVSVPFDASALPGGVYFYRLTLGSTTSSGKMLLVK
jgi:hypothetical protein